MERSSDRKTPITPETPKSGRGERQEPHAKRLQFMPSRRFRRFRRYRRFPAVPPSTFAQRQREARRRTTPEVQYRPEQKVLRFGRTVLAAREAKGDL